MTCMTYVSFITLFMLIACLYQLSSTHGKLFIHLNIQTFQTLFIRISAPTAPNPKGIPMAPAGRAQRRGATACGKWCPKEVRFCKETCKVWNANTISGWWLSHPSEQYLSVGMIIPNNYMKSKKMFETTNHNI